jgi:hypothetical protein
MAGRSIVSNSWRRPGAQAAYLAPFILPECDANRGIAFGQGKKVTLRRRPRM